jgi:hypothetical protein
MDVELRVVCACPYIHTHTYTYTQSGTNYLSVRFGSSETVVEVLALSGTILPADGKLILCMCVGSAFLWLKPLSIAGLERDNPFIHTHTHTHMYSHMCDSDHICDGLQVCLKKTT